MKPEQLVRLVRSVFGVVALSGVVVNESPVLVHYVNQKRAEGEPLPSPAAR
jgi:multidrug efflux pump subunit AcrB